MEDNFKKNIVFIDSLSDVLGRSDDQTTEEVIEELKDLGVDTDKVIPDMLEFVKKCSEGYTFIGYTLEPSKNYKCNKCNNILKIDTERDRQQIICEKCLQP